MQITIIGTGNMGRSIATRAVAGGHSPDADWWPERSGRTALGAASRDYWVAASTAGGTSAAARRWAVSATIRRNAFSVRG